MKFLHKFFNKAAIPWVSIIWEAHYQDSLPGEKMVGSFWWKTILKLLPTYKNHARCIPGIGDTTLFWSDRWLDQSLHLKFPELFSFVINKEIIPARVLEHTEISQLFHRPLSQQAYTQFTAHKTSSTTEKSQMLWTDGHIRGPHLNTPQ